MILGTHCIIEFHHVGMIEGPGQAFKRKKLIPPPPSKETSASSV